MLNASLSFQPVACDKDMCVLTRSSFACLQAQEMLVHARRILGYSYVFAFYMFGQVMFADEISPARNAINQNLFENQQQQLEHMVRRLLPLAEQRACPIAVHSRTACYTYTICRHLFMQA